MKMNITIILLFGVLFFGCAGLEKTIKYNFELDRVERPANALEQYGEIKTTEIDSLGKTYLKFDDDLISTLFYFGNDQIGLILRNKTEHTMKIIWDNAAWISPGGASSRVIHSGVRLVDKNATQASSIVVRQGLLNDSVVPVDNITYVSGKYGGWRYKDLIFTSDIHATDMNVELTKAKAQTGKNCGLLLPIEIEGVQNDYLFSFKIGEAKIIDRY